MNKSSDHGLTYFIHDADGKDMKVTFTKRTQWRSFSALEKPAGCWIENETRSTTPGAIWRGSEGQGSSHGNMSNMRLPLRTTSPFRLFYTIFHIPSRAYSFS